MSAAGARRPRPPRDPGKRPAIETTALFDRDPAAAADAPRPAPIVGGTVLVLLRAAATVLWGAGFLRVWPRIAEEAGVDAGTAEGAAVLGVLIGFGAVWLGVLIVFAVLIWRGSTTARMLALGWTTLTIVAHAIAYFANGEEITVRTTLLTLSLDILVLLALSSRPARTWSRARGEARRARRTRPDAGGRRRSARV
ncbi:hypothetical protein MUN77_15965 [Leucobacter allii]|uniref:hypothetical protein n=1 Tax=Leucobacter allii TaxID=2932247 RepID=UPI001FD51981|nr:hypothetical protein [Leucobacter allii]UOR01594.1 hypothetical protein MUN77_15965 [Leucobacter allii]